MAGVTLLISSLLLFTVFRTMNGYNKMLSTTERYINLHSSANNLQIGSDYLTEQVRCFAESGEIEYLNNYFIEANETRRRDIAIENIEAAVIGDENILKSIKEAMGHSVKLMDREYYSMKLTAQAYHIAPEALPDEVTRISLDPAHESLPDEDKASFARSLVFDETYHKAKNDISESVQKCLSLLIKETEGAQTDASSKLHTLLVSQQALIIILILIVAVVILMTSFQVIVPLLKAVPHIRAEKPIPLMGSFEFRFLAKTYNQMYEANKETKKKLVYEAIHDPLTGLYNRQGYEELCSELNIGTSALLIIDVDNFKSINDSFGHDVGDSILKPVADSIKKSFRAVDFACRIGGDEFAVIMMGTNADHAELIAEKVEKINSELQKYIDDKQIATSVSVGVAFGSEGMKYDELFKRADTALYQVKEHGKKGCAFYTVELDDASGAKERPE
ncbi:MAG: GGDEF domain-containing protein [Clostridia bacterium]|nr:GGDEF domain-containing protein [Clostridia bacterium]